MNFTELCNEVINITKRPDLQSVIEAAVRASTLKLHQKDFFYRDIVEVGVSFPDEEYITSFKPSDVVPRFRKPAYLRQWLYDGTSATFGRGGKKYEPVELGNSQDAYGCFKTDTYYMAGDLLQIRSSTALTHILFGAYVNPDITTDGYKSWIADEYPYAIVYDACVAVFRTIGANEQLQGVTQQAAEWLAILTINSIPQEGF